MQELTGQATTASATSGETARGIAPPGFRLPAATRLGRVRFQVAELERSLAYYQQVLGLRLISRTETDAALGAGGATGDDGANTPLVELHARPGAAPVPQAGRLGLYHFAILLPERAALGRFLTHLGSIGARAGMSDHLVSEAIYLRDPDGLGIEVYADRPRSAWRYDGREIVMETLPLNARDLFAAGIGEEWRGMPAGTRIGHVHLHVGDLERAAAFYHAALGLDRTVWSYPGALFLAAGGYHHHLGVNTWAAGAPTAGEADARLLSWEIDLPPEAAAAAAESIAAAGYDVARDGSGWIARDPWGTAVRLVPG